MLFQYELNIDPGTRTSGYAMTLTYPGGQRIVVALAERRHDGHSISRQLTKRAVHRRRRRGRLHYRKPTGLLEWKPPGWLPPSLEHLLAQHLRMLDAFCALYPVGVIRIETGAFDTALMQNPDLHGAEYQRGTLYGWQLRSYILRQDRYRCAYCDAESRRLELDHIVPVSKGGPTRVGNLVAACRSCNRKKGNRDLEEFLAHDPERVRRIMRNSDTVSYRDATHMNILMPRILGYARNKGIAVAATDATTTAWNRRRLGVEKKHCHDAALLGNDFAALGIMPEQVAVLRTSPKISKRKANVDGGGTPVGKAYKEYCRLSPRERRRTRTPGHSGTRQRHGPQGISTGDIVEIEHYREGKITGVAVVKPSAGRVQLWGTKSPNELSAPLKRTKLLWRRPAMFCRYEAPSQTTRQRVAKATASVSRRGGMTRAVAGNKRESAAPKAVKE